MLDEKYTANEVRALASRRGQLRLFCTEMYTRPPKVADIQSHVQALQDHCGKRLKVLMGQLLPGGKQSNGDYVLDGEYLLSLDFTETLPFKRLPDEDAYLYRKSNP